MAAKRATDVYAYGEAARLLEQALKVQKVLAPDDKARYCEILLVLCHILSISGESRRALDKELEEAYTLAEELGDHARASRACTMAILCLTVYSGGFSNEVWGSPEAIKWVGRADRYAEPETLARAWADWGLAEIKLMSGLFTNQNAFVLEGLMQLKRTLDLARRVGDPQTFWFMACMWLGFARAPQFTRENWRLAEELAGQPRTGVNLESACMTLVVVGFIFLECGNRQRAETMFKESKEMAERSGLITLKLGSMVGDGFIAFLDGHLEEAVEISHSILALGAELNMAPFVNLLILYFTFTPLYHLGRIDEVLRMLQALPQLGANLIKIGCRSLPGPDPEAIATLDQILAMRPDINSENDITAAYGDIFLLEAAVLVGHKKAAELLQRRIAGSGLRMTGFAVTMGVDRPLGEAAALLGRYEEARKYYQEALKISTEMRFRPEVALTRLNLAELLLEHYPAEKKEALEHLDFAIKEFREMKMPNWLERALRHKGILKA